MMGIKKVKNESEFLSNSTSQIIQREAWFDDVFHEVLSKYNSIAKERETKYCGSIWDCSDLTDDELETDILPQYENVIVSQLENEFVEEEKENLQDCFSSRMQATTDMKTNIKACKRDEFQNNLQSQSLNEDLDAFRKEKPRAAPGLRSFYEEMESDLIVPQVENVFHEESFFSPKLSMQGKNRKYSKEKDKRKSFPKRTVSEVTSSIRKGVRVAEKSDEEKIIVETVKEGSSCDSLKIIIEVSSNRGQTFSEIIEERELRQIKQRFPRLLRLIPETNDRFRKIEHSLDTIKVLLRCVLSRSYMIINWDVALETYSAAEFYGVNELLASCEAFFVRYPIPPQNALDIYHTAERFGVENVLLRLKKGFGRQNNLSQQTFQIPEEVCMVAISMSPSEFCLPLNIYGLKTIDGAFSSDVRNYIEFESIDGLFNIFGIQIKLQMCDAEKDSTIPIYYEIINDLEGIHIEETVLKNSESLMTVNFHTRLLVKPQQKAKINISIDDLKLSNCYIMEEESLLHKSRWESFRLRITSNRKIPHSNQKRFFIEKLFYTSKRKVLQ